MAVNKNTGDITYKKKRGLGTYIIIIAVVALIVGGLILFTSGKSSKPADTTPTTPAVTTIPELQSSINSLTSAVSDFSGRLANLETRVNGLVAPDVTREDIDGLQVSVAELSDSLASLNATVANITTFGNDPNSSGSSDYWLVKDTSDNIWLHILSSKNATFIAEVTLTKDNPMVLLDVNASYNTSYTIPYNYTTWNNTTSTNDTITSNITFNITTIATYSDALSEFYTGWHYRSCFPAIVWNSTKGWEYKSVTFYTAPIPVVAGIEWSNYFASLPAYDVISVRLLPSLEVTETGGGGGI